MNTPHKVHIHCYRWAEAEDTLREIRTKVFVDEQQVMACEEWDNLDSDACHYLLTYDQHAAGCARMVMMTEDSARIGRMAILPEYRRSGLAGKLLDFILADARQRHLRQLTLDAQEYVISLYEKKGFTVCTPVFMDAGMPHRTMEMKL